MLLPGLTTQDCYILVKDLLTALFTVLGLIVAASGLATWEKQIKGSREIEVSYNLNYSILKLRAAIKTVRNPLVRPSENRKAKAFLKEKYPEKTEDEAEEDKEWGVYEMRWEKIVEAYTEVESHLMATEVLWGSDIHDLIKPLNKKVTELNIALKQNFNPDLRTKTPQELHKVIYDQSDETGEDKFTQEVSVAVKSIKDYLKNKTK